MSPVAPESALAEQVLLRSVWHSAGLAQLPASSFLQSANARSQTGAAAWWQAAAAPCGSACTLKLGTQEGGGGGLEELLSLPHAPRARANEVSVYARLHMMPPAEAAPGAERQ